MKEKGLTPLDEKLKKEEKAWEGITEALTAAIRPPSDLQPKKRGIIVCLGLGTMGVIALAYLKATWPAFVAEGFLVTVTAILIKNK